MAVEKNVKCAKCKHETFDCDAKLHQEQTQSTHVSVRKDLFKCSECEKRFGNHRILTLHMQIHKANNTNVTASDTNVESEIPGVRQSLVIEPNTPLSKVRQTSSSAAPQETNPSKTTAGLRKVRLEDCLRCDACSCIYLDEADYHKHMRNFHQKATKKSKDGHGKKCRSCCKNCKCSKSPSSRQTCITQLADACRLPYDIKNRWKKLMNGAEKKTDIIFPTKVKIEPEDTYDYSHLLSQVEVSIKTEPDD